MRVSVTLSSHLLAGNRLIPASPSQTGAVRRPSLGRHFIQVDIVEFRRASPKVGAVLNKHEYQQMVPYRIEIVYY